MLYKLSYKEVHSVHGTFVEASSLEMADRVGRAWCEANGTMGKRKLFLSVGQAIVADESILASLPAAPASAETEWMLLTAVQRIARSEGKTEDEVREQLRTKGKPKPPQPAIAEQPAGVLADARAKLRDLLTAPPAKQ